MPTTCSPGSGWCRPVPAPQPFPAAAPAPSARTGVRTTSVPGILLGLGALCLLVAAVIFLAVAWSWLGVGGRTGVLVGLTGCGCGRRLVAARRGLRVAGEALSVVALGLVALDVVGADHAGWWGARPRQSSTWLVGGVVAVAALALAGAPYRLVSPQLVVALAALVAYAGALGATGPDAVVDVVAVLVLAAAAWAGLRTGRAVLAYAVGTAAVLPWMHLALDALARALEDPTLREVWAGPGPALVAASLLVLLPVAGHREPTAVAALGGVAATLLTITVALPAVDEGGTAATGAALAATLAWTAAAWLLRARDAWRLLPLIPALASAVPVAGVVLALSVQAVTAVGSSGPVFARDADVRIGSVDPVAAPWLLLAGVAALVALAWVSARPPAAWWTGRRHDHRPRGGRHARAAAGAPRRTARRARGCRGSVARDGRPPGGDRGAARRHGRRPAQRPAHRARGAHRGRGRRLVPAAGRERELPAARRRVTPPAAAVAVWAFAEVAGMDEALRGYPVLVAVGLLALSSPARGRGDRMGGRAGGRPAAISAAADPVTATAIHLTVAGGLVVASSLVHPHRRGLAGQVGCCWRPRPGSGSPTSASRRPRPTRCRRPWRCSWSAWTGSGATGGGDGDGAHPRTPARDGAVAVVVPRRPGSWRPRGWASPASGCCRPAPCSAGTHRCWWEPPSAGCWWCASWRRTPPEIPQWVLIGTAGGLLTRRRGSPGSTGWPRSARRRPTSTVSLAWGPATRTRGRCRPSRTAAAACPPPGSTGAPRPRGSAAATRRPGPPATTAPVRRAATSPTRPGAAPPDGVGDRAVGRDPAARDLLDVLEHPLDVLLLLSRQRPAPEGARTPRSPGSPQPRRPPSPRSTRRAAPAGRASVRRASRRSARW